MYQLASVFLLMSGIAALTYQVTWVRLLGLSMGSTSASISTVLAAFFLGMALGSYAAEKITRNRINSLMPYVILEAVIAVSGLLLLPALLNLDALMATFPALGSALPAKFTVAMALLCLPTLAMGATFPVMAAILVRRRNEVGLRIGQLYSLNTAGAVLGAALSGFVFIPTFGLDGAIYVAVFLNAAIVMLGLWFNRRVELPPLQNMDLEPGNTLSARPANAALPALAMMVLFFTGLISIATEVGWTKYLAIFTGTTIYGFAAILAIFLTGIALGSWAVKSHIEQMRRPEAWLAWGLVATGVLLLLTRAGLSAIPAIYEGINHMGAPGAVKQGIKYLVVLLLLLPPTFLFGALFPLNLKLYCGNLAGVRSRVGKAYAINTVASILGSIIAGFWIIPEYGTDSLLTLAAVLLLALPLLFLATLAEPARRVAMAGAVVAAIAANWLLPHIDYKDMIASVDYAYDTDASAGAEPKFLFLGEGKAAVISLVTYDDEIAKVQANGLNESLIDLHNPHNALVIESLLAYMPYFLHDDPKSAFIVGYGGGITTRAFTHTGVESIHVVELEPTVVKAGYAIEGGPATALDDPRVLLEYNDARNTLLVQDQTYDLIAAQPSHPWLAGVANVFTQEFFEIVKSRLNDGGIYSQWVNLFRMDVTTLRAIMKAFYNVFPHGFTLANLDTGDYMLIGSAEPLRFDYEQIGERMKRPAIAKTLAQHEVYEPQDLLWYFGLSRQEAVKAAGDITPNRDTNIFSEVRLSALVDEPTGEENPYPFLFDNYHFDFDRYITRDEAPKRLFDAGIFFLKWNSPDVAEKIVHQLETIDNVWARSLMYELLVWKYDEEKASAWYEQHDQWLDRTHVRQAELYLQAGKPEQAESALKRVQDEQLRRVGLARLLYQRGEWAALAALDAKTDEERKWQLVGLARTDLSKAGAQLAKLIDDESEEIPHLRVLVEYFAANRDDAQMDKWARQLIELIDDRIYRLKDLARAAMDAGNAERAQRLIDEIEKLNPTAEGLSVMRERLGRQVPSEA